MRLISIVLCGIALSACNSSSSDIDPGVVGDGFFQVIVDEYVENRNLPAITIIITKDGEEVDSASSGKRSLAKSIAVTEDDQWQIGSLTKGVTATLAARLVELGFISWDTTVGDIFSENIEQIHLDNRSITLADLLRHRSGLTRDVEPSNPEKLNLDRFGYNLRVLGYAPSSTRGSFSYSNIGYAVAGVMLGRVTGLTWEEAIQQFLFTPLEITDYGMGFPDPGDALSQPIGHIRRTDHSGERINDYWIPIPPSESKLLDALPVVRQPNNCGFSDVVCVRTKAPLRRHIGHTSSKGNAGAGADNVARREPPSRRPDCVEFA